MIFVLFALLIFGVLLGPQLWVTWVMKRYSAQRDDFPGTGGELAHHLLKRLKLPEVKVEETDKGDHYDPQDKAVRLTANNFHGKSLTAITVAAHEVGHALQDNMGYQPLHMRTRMVQLAAQAQKAGAVLMLGIPLIIGLSRAPMAGALFLVAGLLSLGSAVVVHLITLPVELDASFRRALPLLETGGYVSERDHPAARRILTAASLTYVSSALMSLLNVWWWLRMLRR